MISRSTQKIRMMVELSVLTALVVLLQLLCSVMTIPVINITITLSLVPLVIGAAMHGIGAGVWLGFVLGLVNLATSFTGPLYILFDALPPVYILVCFGKTMAAGAIAGLLFRVFKDKKPFLGVCLASVSAPIVNTGIFFIFMALFFQDALVVAFGSGIGGNVVGFVITGLIGVNFLVELGLNAVLCPAIHRIIHAVHRRKES